MSVQGARIRKGKLGANALGSPDSISGLIANGVAVVSKIALGEVKELRSPEDAEDLGLDKAYDLANSVRVYYHISEFYRLAGRGKKLYIMLVAQTVTLSQMVDVVSDVYAKKLAIEADGEIKQIAFARNPAAGYVATILDGLDADVLAAIPKGQALHEWSLETHRPFQVFLEGRDYTGPVGSATDLRDIDNVQATKVSVCIGQDWDYAETLDALGKKHAAIGTMLGSVAKLRVNQNIGEVETMNLTDATKGAFLTAGLSSHQKSSEVENSWDSLDAKGYIFAMKYTGLDGARWNGDHTCTPIIRDNEGKINEHTISYGRTVDKAVRKLRTALLPKVKTVQPVDPATGKLPTGVVKYFEGLGDTELENMGAAAEISGGKTYVNPDSQLLVAPRVLEMGFSIVPFGTIDEIDGVINLKTSL